MFVIRWQRTATKKKNIQWKIVVADGKNEQATAQLCYRKFKLQIILHRYLLLHQKSLADIVAMKPHLVDSSVNSPLNGRKVSFILEYIRREKVCPAKFDYQINSYF